MLSSILCASKAQTQLDQTKRRILPGDRLVVTILEQPSLNKIYPVAGDGTIQIPDMGRIRVGEKTLERAADSIRDHLLTRYFKQATVEVSISEFVKGSIHVTGSVNHPKSIQFEGDKIITLYEAIIAAGGFAHRANGAEVKILRWKPGAGLEREIITKDVRKMIDDLDFSSDEYLRPRDIVYVPRLKGEASKEVLLIGEVGQVGYHQHYEGLDVLRLIANTGGIPRTAKPDSARLLRKQESGDYNTIPVDLSVLLGNGDMGQNYPLYPGDILYVPADTYKSSGQAYILGEVEQQGPLDLPLKGEIGVAKALLARGKTKFSNFSRVKLQRRDVDGTKQTITIDVDDILKTGSFEDDIPLQDGDVLIVPERIVLP